MCILCIYYGILIRHCSFKYGRFWTNNFIWNLPVYDDINVGHYPSYALSIVKKI